MSHEEVKVIIGVRCLRVMVKEHERRVPVARSLKGGAAIDGSNAEVVDLPILRVLGPDNCQAIAISKTVEEELGIDVLIDRANDEAIRDRAIKQCDEAEQNLYQAIIKQRNAEGRMRIAREESSRLQISLQEAEALASTAERLAEDQAEMIESLKRQIVTGDRWNDHIRGSYESLQAHAGEMRREKSQWEIQATRYLAMIRVADEWPWWRRFGFLFGFRTVSIDR